MNVNIYGVCLYTGWPASQSPTWGGLGNEVPPEAEAEAFCTFAHNILKNGYIGNACLDM